MGLLRATQKPRAVISASTFVGRRPTRRRCKRFAQELVALQPDLIQSKSNRVSQFHSRSASLTNSRANCGTWGQMCIHRRLYAEFRLAEGSGLKRHGKYPATLRLDPA